MNSTVKNSLLILALVASSNVLATECVSKVATSVEGDVVVSTNTIVVCATGSAQLPKPKKIVKIGDQVFENELLKLGDTNFFKHKGMECRMFRELYMLDTKLREAQGVICHIEEQSEFWQVVDKW
jgi:hypothetical protein